MRNKTRVKTTHVRCCHGFRGRRLERSWRRSRHWCGGRHVLTFHTSLTNIALSPLSTTSPYFLLRPGTLVALSFLLPPERSFLSYFLSVFAVALVQFPHLCLFLTRVWPSLSFIYVSFFVSHFYRLRFMYRQYHQLLFCFIFRQFRVTPSLTANTHRHKGLLIALWCQLLPAVAWQVEARN